MKEKKTWIAPTLTLLSNGYVEGGNNPAVHEKTGHASSNTPNNHSVGNPFAHFINAPGTSSLVFTQAATS
jgi:hypothetical protein